MPVPASVSVVVPIYNGRSLLRRTLAGLITQTYPADAVEVIVADDGSDDGPEQVLEELRCDFLLRIVRQPRHGFRLASIRNRAILSARGDVIVSLDGDTIPCPNLVAAHVAKVASQPMTVSIGPREYIDASDVTPTGIQADPTVLERLPTVASTSNWLSARDRRTPELRRLGSHPAPYNCLHACNCAYPRDVALQVGLYDTDFNGHWGYEDTEFAYRLWRAGCHFQYTPEARAFHQENAVVTFASRVAGDEHNFELACRKIPGFRAFKQRLRERGREPWW